ncbi:MAG: hypothetical protein ABI865_06155 [Nitrosospira sp.]
MPTSKKTNTVDPSSRWPNSTTKVTKRDFIFAQEILESAKLSDGVFVLGCFQSGVTIYKQQVRAHNLVWALYMAKIIPKHASIAVIGGGVGGLTLASATSLIFSDAQISLFEKHSDLCPLQLGCDSRWIHPHIYDWPSKGSRLPSATLPILDWREGRASDVAAQILDGFRRVLEDTKERISIFLEVGYIRLQAKHHHIDWIGKATKFEAGHFLKQKIVGDHKNFDIVFIASGFGRESFLSGFAKRLYWQNDHFAQPSLTDDKNVFIVSGAGDGALIDLFRLSIERFRQDRILYELFGNDLIEFERVFAAALVRRGSQLWLDFFDSFLEKNILFSNACANLGKRMRNDTKVILQIGGVDGKNKEFSATLEKKNSVQNKLIAFLAYRNGGFIPAFGTLEDVVAKYQVDPQNTICRHGTNSQIEIEDFVFLPDIDKRFAYLKRSEQSAMPAWTPGFFPNT